MSIENQRKRSQHFEEVCSTDFLKFQFNGRSYQDQLYDSISKTGELAAVKVERVSIPLSHLINNGSENLVQDVVWVSHNFGFLGGSLGCAEGEKITRAFEYALEHKLPICVQCRSGGARMQEGTSSLMQMAKVSVAVQALQDAGLPFISVLNDPTFGGVSASYAMQADVRLAVAKNGNEARIGFAGPAVILNTMCETNQELYDKSCPPDFQSATFVKDNGQIDQILEIKEGSTDEQTQIEDSVALMAYLLTRTSSLIDTQSQRTLSGLVDVLKSHSDGLESVEHLNDEEMINKYKFNYTKSRHIDRPQAKDLIVNLFDAFQELSGDGKFGKDMCLRGGLAQFKGISCVVMGTYKGHTPTEMEKSNYGMPSPHGYRTALRLMKLAERFHLPVVTLVDTVGAWPTFECERIGQSEAIATNLTAMAGLKVPIISLVIGEGGSGGALGIGMGNTLGMLSGAYFGVISPEGAASILGRYKDEAHKLVQFPKDCQDLATAQCIYAYQLKALGIVDHIVWEESNEQGEDTETFKNFPILKSRIEKFVYDSLVTLCALDEEKLIEQRYHKFRSIGSFSSLDGTERSNSVQLAKQLSTKKTAAGRGKTKNSNVPLVFKHLSEEVVSGERSKYRGLAPKPLSGPLKASNKEPTLKGMDFDYDREYSAKYVLDTKGVDFLCKEWIPKQTKDRILITDTTLRDAHQSLLATRVRTQDLVKGAKIASKLLSKAFSLECWGGATFDVCMRFLDECPWERLRQIRAACPNVCLQMLIRGANAVGYTSYPDNVVEEFVHLAAKNGIDVFRVFDCFNVVDNMRVATNAVKSTGKIAEVCICYTGNVLTSPIYNLEYYASVAKEIKEMGANILGIKDMAGLLRPMEAKPLMKVLREVVGEDMPIHFHTHATSSGSLTTCFEMAREGCNIIDCATASMADGTSQPSMNTFLAMMQPPSKNTGINYLDLEPYDEYWAKVRATYSPFESGMLSGSARVFEHQIPGGQYSNLLVQCKSLGMMSAGEDDGQWSKVLDAYRDVNKLFGDIVKVTPSSKCVGDMALYLVLRGLTTADLIDPETGKMRPEAVNLDFPQSVVGLFKGELGFPHRGFPEEVKKLILRSKENVIDKKIVLPAADLKKNVENLSKEWNQQISEEEGMSSLMYPKVFSDYMKKLNETGPLLRHLPTQVYFYALAAGDSFNMLLDKSSLSHFFSSTDYEASLPTGKQSILVQVSLQRVGPLYKGHRTLYYHISIPNLEASNDGKPTLYEESLEVVVRDTGGEFVFEGPMADSKDNNDIGSPMNGVVEKVLVTAGQEVKSGDVLCLISAMKMEVKVSAPRDGKVASVAIPSAGYRVIEGSLLFKME